MSDYDKLQPTNGLANGNGSSNLYFTRNPTELKGDFLKTRLLKTSNGFGFTIIGANETKDDFLQIKFIVPNGSAHVDKRIATRRYTCVCQRASVVLGYSHQDVVEMFQSIPIGDYVELSVCRGYPLTIDPNDPNVEIKSLAAINNTNGNSGNTHPPLQPLQQPLNEEEDVDSQEYQEYYVEHRKRTKRFRFHNSRRLNTTINKK